MSQLYARPCCAYSAATGHACQHQVFRCIVGHAGELGAVEAEVAHHSCTSGSHSSSSGNASICPLIASSTLRCRGECLGRHSGWQLDLTFFLVACTCTGTP